MIDTNIYLTSRRFYWYNKNNEEKYSYKDCYVFTQSWFTNAMFVRPEFEYLPQNKIDEIFSKSHLVGKYGNDIKFAEIREETQKELDKILADTETFFEEVNNGKVKPSQITSFDIGKVAIIYGGELGENITTINNAEFLTPMKNLLINLIEECASSESDKLELYFNPKNEIVYLAWRWDDCGKKGVSWVGGIMPCLFKDVDFVLEIQNTLYDELQTLSGKKYYNHKFTKEVK